MAVDGAGSAEHADVACARDAAEALDGGAYHAEDAPCRVDARQVILLNGAEGFGGGGVAREYDEASNEREPYGARALSPR